MDPEPMTDEEVTAILAELEEARRLARLLTALYASEDS